MLDFLMLALAGGFFASASKLFGAPAAAQDASPDALVRQSIDETLALIRANDPTVQIVAHPECPPDVIEALSEAHRLLYRARVGLDHAREMLRSHGLLVPAVNYLLAFIQNQQEGRHGRGRERRRAA